MRGLRLRDVGKKQFTWHDLSVIIKHLPADSALAKSVNGDADLTTPQVQLLASIADYTALNVWLQTEDGAKGRNRPKPILRQLQGSRGKPVEQDHWEYDEEYVKNLDKIFAAPRVAA